MGLSDIGNLVCLPFEEIEPGQPTNVHDLFLQEAINVLRVSQRNWLPLIVKETGVDQYKVVANTFVYAAISRAGLEEAWCIVVDDSNETAEACSVLAQDGLPRINLSTASRKQIATALDYLLKQPGTLLKGVNLSSATSRIESAPRKYWQTFEPITKLKCKITKGKLKELKKVFYLEPEPIPEIITDPVLLDTFTAAELKKMAGKRGFKRYSKLSKANLIKRLSENKKPEPLPEVVTDPALLDTFTVTELKKIAKKRGITGYSKLKKADLIKRLSETD
ncbi:transcription termination factor rho family protein [Leptolyngbyaceae cyanobacterium CCMR0082]|uniref:Transcription termination factor rho family protein n=1 Tax=Adonisia turfae CCMR0082 TaxID=2304604 RepID=A0A6M0RY95_9CYAN|nr:Rho termination factor N-terminal domain-containing protein [Adonisia turfae]NEZ61188.1 transcription termination factor rho family protein [Adonisia turfae CCMR0082]